MEIKNKPYNLLLYSALLLLGVSFFVSGEGGLNAPDTYVIMPLDSVLMFIATVLIVLWILYKLTACFLYSEKLIWIHVILTLLGAIVCILIILSSIIVHSVIDSDGSKYDIVGFTIAGPILIPVLIQLIYFVNLGLGIWPRQKASPLNK